MRQQYILIIDTGTGVNIDLELEIKKTLMNYGHYSCRVALEEHSGRSVEIVAVKKQENEENN